MARTPITGEMGGKRCSEGTEYARRRDQDEPKGEAVSRDCGLRGQTGRKESSQGGGSVSA